MQTRSQAWRKAVLHTLMATAAVAARAAESPDVLQLSGTYGCMSCHGMVRKQVGPGFAQIAERYRNLFGQLGEVGPST